MTERQRRKRPASRRAWSYIAGEKGKNRVRVYDRPSHGLWIDYRDEHGKRVRQPLGHTDQDRARLKAEDVAARFRRLGTAPPAALTLSRLFENYEREVTPRKAATTQAHDRRTFKLFLRAFGAQRRPATLNVRDWDSYIARRRTGELAPPGREGKPVRAQIIAHDCKLLRAVCNWAVRAGDGTGGYLLERNPIAGLPMPREESPRRPVVSREQFEALRTAAAVHSTQAECFTVLAWFAGHRSKSIRHLRWADVDLEGARIHWRGESDKIEYDHWNPLHAAAVEVLARQKGLLELTSGKPVDGAAWLFPSPVLKDQPLSREAVSKLWTALATTAKVPKGEGYGWHAFRRAFANTLRDVPLRELKDLGGWKTEKTVVSTYLQPDEDAQRRGLSALDGAR